MIFETPADGRALRLLLVDSHELVREALRDALLAQPGVESVAEANDAEEAILLASRTRPDIVLMEVWLPQLSGIDAIRRIEAASPDSRVLIVSANEARSAVEESLRSGARGYVVKRAPMRELFEAMDAVEKGLWYLSPAIANHAVAAVGHHGVDPKSASSIADLTSRERQVLQGISEGQSSKEIAKHLAIAPRTVDSHRTNLMRKLGVNKASGLVRVAIREGWVSP